MLSKETLFFSLLFSTYAVSGIYTTPANNTIEWFACKQNDTVTVSFICGTLAVPRDYTALEYGETLELSLVKVKAAKQPKKGSILFNPGGPGAGGREFVLTAAEELLIATGGSYDLIGFDTRGTGNTLPFSCYNNPIERAVAEATIPQFTDESDTALGHWWASATTLAQSCYENAKDVGELIGTAFVARDMIKIVDALGEDGLLHYWGISYGTLLGATVSAMFPDKIGRVILDGVLNSKGYYAEDEVENLTDTDAMYKGFFKECLANPDSCALAADGTTAEEVNHKVDELMQQLKYYPITAGGVVLDYRVAKYTIMGYFHNTAAWPGLAYILHMILTGNLTIVGDIADSEQSPLYGDLFPDYGPEAVWGIHCGDVTLRTNNLSTILPLIDQMAAKSAFFGDGLAQWPIICSQWPFNAKERYTGNFQVETKNPLLLIGNTVDPLTPLVSARNVSAGFKGSVVLQHDAYGHSSLSQPSLCTAKTIRAYFEHGILPAPGTICKPNFSPFSNETYVEAYASIANYTKRAFVDDDEALLAATIKLGAKRFRPFNF